MWKRWWWGVGGGILPARSGDRRRSPARRPTIGRARALLLLAPVIAGVVAPGAHAFDVPATCGPEERALAMERSTSSLVFEASPERHRGNRWRFGAGEWALFGIDGLAVGAFTAEVWRGNWGGIVAAGLLSSPVGTESVLSGTLLAASDGPVRLAGEVRLETVAVHGCRRASLLSLSIDAVVRLSSRVLMGSRIGGVGVAGTPQPGADASLRVVAFPGGPLCTVTGITMSRSGVVACELSSRVRLARRARVALGYEGGAAAITGSLSIGVRALVLEVGASVHPVLGVSKALFVSWRWGVWE